MTTPRTLRTRRTPVRSGLALCVLLLGLPSVCQAQTVRAFLDQTQVPVNGQFVLNVEVSGVQQMEGDPVLPDLSAFAAFLGSSTSTSMQFVNGRTSMGLTIQYRYQATREGTFEIGSVQVRAGGQGLRTDPLTIAISNAPAPTGRSNGRRDEGGVAPEDLFLTTTTSTTRVYVNQPVVIEYRIFTRVDVEGYDITRQPTTAGFWVEELGDAQGQVEQVVRDGLQYASAVVRRVALFPTSSGPKTIEPLTLEARVRVQRRSRSRFGDPFGDRFGSVFGGGLFGSRVPVVVASDAVDIDVLALPAGQPESFSGLVGQLEVSASVDRTSAATNDALTYRLEVAGSGNIRSLPEPELRFPPSLEVYPPEVSEQVQPAPDGIRGSRTFEYVLVPRTPGQTTIPAVEIAYLDADSGTYQVAASAPIRLEISGDPVAAPAGPVGRLRTGIDLQRQDIRFIRIAMPGLRPMGGTLFSSPWFWFVLVTPLVGLAGTVAVRRHEDRLRGDVGYARRRRASRVAKERLAAAEALRAPNQHRDFHGEIGRALQGFLGDKLNVAEAGLIRDEVRSRLLERGVPETVADRYLGCLEACDRQRFAPISPDEAAMQEMLGRAAQAMTDLDEAL